jgi:two-component system cell cycle sensor histidine kinase/response regulator CckA
MQAIGEFAGGLAHDFNNLLTAIRGHAELAYAEAAEGSTIRADLDQVIRGTDRASAITRKLLAFTRRQVLDPVLLDPGRLVSDLMPTVSTLLGNDIDAILRIAPQHQWVRVDPTQLEQVIVNLVVNGRDAMPGGGTLTIAVGDVEQPRAERPDTSATASLAVRISVTDTGVGMDETVKSRVFDPFFTTKPLGKGTGLGLATVFGIVTQSGGRVEARSRLGEGSTFIVDLPEFAAPSAPSLEHRVSPATEHASGVVLLVEDEASVRDFARRALEASGFMVLSASSGKEAVRASERWLEQIDVLLTDVVMDGMQGPDVVSLLRLQRPDIGVIYMSGYALDILDRTDPGDYDAFIPKPFTAAALTAAVARVVLATRLEHPASVNNRPTVGSLPRIDSELDAKLT